MLQGYVGKFLDLLNHWFPLNKQKPMVSSPGKNLMLVARKGFATLGHWMDIFPGDKAMRWGKYLEMIIP